MLFKPVPWAVSPYRTAVPSLYEDLAFITPFMQKQTGRGVMLGKNCSPLAGANLTAGSTFQWRSTPYGLGFGRTGTGNALILSQNNFAPIVTSDGAGTGNFTLLMLANPVAENVIATGFNQSVDGGTTATMALSFNYDSSGAATAGWLMFHTRDTANGNGVTAAANLVDSDYHVYGIMRKGTLHSIWRDGIRCYTVAQTPRDIYVSGTSDLAFGSNAVTGASAIKDNTNIVFAAGWNETRSDDDMRLLGSDPFIMVRADNVKKYYFPPVGGDALWYPRIRRRRR